MVHIVETTEKHIKLCFWCKYCNWTNADHGYSDMTPGWDFDVECSKHVWEFDKYKTTSRQFGTYVSMAETCLHYILQDFR